MLVPLDNVRGSESTLRLRARVTLVGGNTVKEHAVHAGGCQHRDDCPNEGIALMTPQGGKILEPKWLRVSILKLTVYKL